ncbi:ABC transporter ATP-binding protein [Actinomadura craniellae]|uniref:ABC transporter ATP-binding protein n=2 Tax=Actinomadura craniellae TaxID=2231787 RepID=A0A365GZ48_9ACTN|nr:ABC transporter ATP-binding protein [Actinomadura craniellae]RAY12114.1 ABC transporter ATP-binding protein [Actinomadura craniellae]
MASAMLAIRDLTVNYGRSVQALRGVSLEVAPGTVTAVLGANGAGKTTLLRAISGTLGFHRGTVDGGTITYGDQQLSGLQPPAVVARGVVQVPEGRRIFGRLTVDENLRAGGLGAASRSGAAATRERILELFPVLAERHKQRAGLLSGGEQQMLAIGRALMAAPKVLLLDEPTLGLAPMMAERIGETIAAINEQGTSVLLIEQNAALALRLATNAYVLEVGSVALSGTSAELSASDEVRRRYLGVGETDEGGPLHREDRPKLTRWAG